jgi:hypothetical protein
MLTNIVTSTLILARRWGNGKRIDWVSPEPFIRDSEARTITFASQFVSGADAGLPADTGILYAHVDDSFVRAYTLRAEEVGMWVKGRR